MKVVCNINYLINFVWKDGPIPPAPETTGQGQTTGGQTTNGSSIISISVFYLLVATAILAFF